MIDRREQILAQLLVILAGVEGIKAAWRNRGELPDDLRPAITLLDADEAVTLQGPQSSRGGGGLTAARSMITMRPEIFILLEQREPKNVNVGQDVNALRVKVIAALSADSSLNTLLTNNGSVVYEGCLTDTATGRGMTGQLQMQFAFSYPFNATDFAP